MDLIKATDFVVNKLKNNLDSRLYYHNVNHTLDVVSSAKKIAKTENINDYETSILLVAALFHDTGFMFAYKGHEKESVKFAEDNLPKFGYSEKDISKISKLILATEITTQPTTKLEKIICDADLYYLGRSDFSEISNNLFKEWKAYNFVDTQKEWYKLQIVFFNNHFYHIPSVNKLQEIQKQANFLKIENYYNTIK